MQIFITGGTGLVGSATIRALLASSPKYAIRALARSATAAQTLSGLGATPVSGDVTDLDLLTKEGTTADAVVYCAFDHSGDWGAQAGIETRAITALCKALSSSGQTERPKMLMYCAGLASFPASPTATESTLFPPGPRSATVAVVEQYSSASPPSGVGVRGVQLRLGMIVHQEDRTHPFLGFLNRQSHFGYYQDGTNEWPATYGPDAGALVARVLEQQDKISNAKVTALHASAERVSTKDISEALAKNAGVTVEPFGDEVLKGLNPMAQRILVANPGVINDWTRSTFAWEPMGHTLMEDIKEGKYFQQ